MSKLERRIKKLLLRALSEDSEGKLAEAEAKRLMQKHGLSIVLEQDVALGLGILGRRDFWREQLTHIVANYYDCACEWRGNQIFVCGPESAAIKARRVCWSAIAEIDILTAKSWNIKGAIEGDFAFVWFRAMQLAAVKAIARRLAKKPSVTYQASGIETPTVAKAMETEIKEEIADKNLGETLLRQAEATGEFVGKTVYLGDVIMLETCKSCEELKLELKLKIEAGYKQRIEDLNVILENHENEIDKLNDELITQEESAADLESRTRELESLVSELEEKLEKLKHKSRTRKRKIKELKSVLKTPKTSSV